MQPSTTSEIQFVLNYPLIFFVIVVVVFILYRYLKRRQDELSMDDNWLDTSTNDQ